MSETFFPINDLLRRKLQTGLVVFALALSVASTLFLLLLGDKIGFGILSMAEDRLTASFLSVFSNFIIFVGFLVFLVGVIIVSFMVFVMMSQRVRDIGLMKAAGCPNDLVFGYFMNELIIVVFVGCLLGVAFGIAADYASTNLLNSMGFSVVQEPINFWVALIVFLLFLALSLIVGAKPVLDATRIEPTKAVSPSYYYGLRKESDFKGSAKAGLSFKIALRSLFRRKSATLRIIFCLTAVFILATVAIAGGLIANQTTRSWVERGVGKDIVLIAHRDTCSAYSFLLKKFYEARESPQFNYTDDRYQITEALLNRLDMLQSIRTESRLVLEAQVKEIEGWTIDPETAVTKPVGDSRQGKSLVVGVEPQRVLGEWLLDGSFLNNSEAYEAVVGDSLARRMFSEPLNQSVELFGNSFDIVGACLDPVDNGMVVYVPLRVLENVTGFPRPNVIMARVEASADGASVIGQIREAVLAVDSDFEVLELNEVLDRAVGFIGFLWSTIMFVPLFSLSAAALCLIGYVILSINEQRQEFGVLRAVGAKPGTVVKIVATQNALILASSYAIGISLGIMTTLLILMPDPLVTSYTLLEIAGWLLLALAGTFIFSLYPAIRFARKPILEIMAQM
jgi:putative ABC transport system permease protein